MFRDSNSAARKRGHVPCLVQGVTPAAAMFKADRWRQIDAVIDYFGGIYEARALGP
jgi:hypothetical protein